jgi:hypothetical protein
LHQDENENGEQVHKWPEHFLYFGLRFGAASPSKNSSLTALQTGGEDEVGLPGSAADEAEAAAEAEAETKAAVVVSPARSDDGGIA